MMSGGGMGMSPTMSDDVAPLTIAEAKDAATAYLDGLDPDALSVGEVMIFDNHAYVQVIDTQLEQGAFEVLVDPVTRAVMPEPGPNMMWNRQYGYMGSMMNESSMSQPGRMSAASTTTDSLPVSPEEAIATAQRYLDVYGEGLQAADTADVFPGYYTIHTIRDGETVGMLSVNGFTRQVWLHTWHGALIDMTEGNHT